MNSADLIVMLAYLAGMPLLAVMLSGRQSSTAAYLEGGHDLPWWALCLSMVATETSTLTVISVPGVAFGSGMVFVGLALGYLLGRALVAWKFLPLYSAGRMLSAYDYLGQRFGQRMQRVASATFLGTRVLAEAVRLFAGMLPLTAMLAATHMAVPHTVLLLGVVGITLFYTVCGGLRAVVWSDAIQFCLYLAGSAMCAALLLHGLPAGAATTLRQAGKFNLFLHGTAPFSSAFTPIAAIGGGALMTLASHGTDQLMVQRVLAARSLKDARLALMGSAVGVTALFFLLSGVGILLWMHHGQLSVQAAGFSTPDAIFPDYIVHGLPAGLRGLMVAAILAATMGSLSSTLSAMTAATMGDFSSACSALSRKLSLTPLGLARVLTVFWSAVLVGCSLLFAQGSQSAVLLGLSIAACGYGPMLGTFLAGMALPSARAADLLPAFCLTVPLVLLAMAALHPGGHALAFPWLILLGIILLFAFAVCARLVRGVFPRLTRTPEA
ncbi:sodium:solute symporter [Acetobacter farinalis]|uniref:Sodium:solute symporter n=1 Tax=Acetobacter farinalis TaxID=1260984 RepID=A0ABT3Q888_9PROT|nr:sodium:solute symporter [Acetobacter farinalis]MCX2561508.1 sodium:solute symporter [Acetobacter farinalis]NHO30425.1 sodium:proline symporter [Acetobacter farinalis]